MSCRRRPNAGFTLVELMIVVAIIGVLAALAIYGVSRYMRHAKTAEATRSLGAMEVGNDVQYGKETPFGGSFSVYTHQYCPSVTPTPAAVPRATKITVATVPGSGTDYDQPGWQCLKFLMVNPQFYQYGYTSNGASGLAARYTASAAGDLDGNGNQSLFQTTGRGGDFGESMRESFTVVNEDD